MDTNKWTARATVVATLASLVSAGFSYLASSNSSEATIQIARIEQEKSYRQSDIEMVKLALNILGGAVSDKTQESRRFAVSLLGRYSGVEIDGITGSTWVAAGTVSFAEKNIGLSSALATDPDIAGIQRLAEAIIAGMVAEKLKRLNSMSRAASPVTAPE